MHDFTIVAPVASEQASRCATTMTTRAPTCVQAQSVVERGSALDGSASPYREVTFDTRRPSIM
jgi:hypothetical protein